MERSTVKVVYVKKTVKIALKNPLHVEHVSLKEGQFTTAHRQTSVSI